MSERHLSYAYPTRAQHLAWRAFRTQRYLRLNQRLEMADVVNSDIPRSLCAGGVEIPRVPPDL